jgi:hypothetical protein
VTRQSGQIIMSNTTTNECPCGRARAGCTYHDPALQPAPQVTVDFNAMAHWKKNATGQITHVTFAGHVPRAVASPEVEITGVQFKTLQVTKQAQNTKLFTLVVDPANHNEYQCLKYLYATPTAREWPFDVKWDDFSFEFHPRACWHTLPTRDPVTGLATYIVRVLP